MKETRDMKNRDVEINKFDEEQFVRFIDDQVIKLILHKVTNEDKMLKDIKITLCKIAESLVNNKL